MSMVVVTKDFIVLPYSKKLLLYYFREDTTKWIKFPSFGTLGALSNEENIENPRNGSQKREAGAAFIKVSDDSHLVAVVSTEKVLIVWDVSTWEVLFTHTLVKRPMALAFIPNKSSIVVADKSGDVYSFDFQTKATSDLIKIETTNGNISSTNKDDSLTDEEDGPEPLLGHFSMLLDICVSTDGKYVITCDRDEKIRVSCYPNSYSIHTFCLGHQEFVNHVSLCPHDPQLLVSCSGDGTIRLWDFQIGKCEDILDTATNCSFAREITSNQISPPSLSHNDSENMHSDEETNESPQQISNKENHTAVTDIAVTKFSEELSLLAATLYKVPEILLYKITDRKIVHLSNHTLQVIPLDMCWLENQELVIISADSEHPISVLKYENDSLITVSHHALVKFGDANRETLKSLSDNRSMHETLQGLYKQKYDNMADYLKKKQERLQAQNITPIVKKGRWSK